MQEVHARIVLGSAGPTYAGMVPPQGAAGDDDPFIESKDRAQLLGVARVVLNPLAFLVEIDETLSVITYFNEPIGTYCCTYVDYVSLYSFTSKCARTYECTERV